MTAITAYPAEERVILIAGGRSIRSGIRQGLGAAGDRPANMRYSVGKRTKTAWLSRARLLTGPRIARALRIARNLFESGRNAEADK